MNIRFAFCYLIIIVFNLTETEVFCQSKVNAVNYPNSKEIVGNIKLYWRAPAKIKITESETQNYLSFEGAQYATEDGFLPRYYQKLTLNANEKEISAEITNPKYEILAEEEASLIKKSNEIKNQIDVRANVLVSKKKPYGEISFIPIRKNENTGKYEKLVSFNLSTSTFTQTKSGSIGNSENGNTRSVNAYAANSVLQNGTWYKIGIPSDGIYKLSFSFLQKLGIDMSAINPHNIRIYGNGGGMLPESNALFRQDDLIENAIYVEGESDAVFDAQDYVLFYGKGPQKWSFNNFSSPKYTHTLNLYSDTAYYFINTDLGAGKRIQTEVSSVLPITNIVNSFDDYAYHENSTVNFIKSGREWFGEYFGNTNSYNFSFSFPNTDFTAPATVKASIASRYLIAGLANYSISSQSGDTLLSIPNVSGSSYDSYARISAAYYSFIPTNSTITVNVTKETNDAIAWLNYIEVNLRRQLIMSGSQLFFRDAQSVGAGKVSQFNITSSLPIQIWDISDIANIKIKTTSNSIPNQYEYVMPTETLNQFVAFTGASFNTPIATGIIANQNLHALADKDFIIVTHPDFYQEAQQLAAHHESKDNLSTIIVTPQQIYNEFSSGAQDISAIRDFVRMFYNKAVVESELPQYLLLFGDGSYDNKNRFNNNSNYIPTYQSNESTVPTLSYVTDDFYGLLDNMEGLWTSDAVDIGIGRFPARTKADAMTAVNKIINYTKTGFSLSESVTNSCSSQIGGSPFGNWRNTVCFIGDDEDGNIHMSQADQESALIDTAYNDYTIDKIYLDAYQQEGTPGGNRYPEVVDAINNRVEQGALIINYTGHGGEVGLSHERVIELSQINKWNNANRLFLFFTATCEFSRYDDPERTSAGEYAFLNPNGAAIALFSTVRLVFASPNFYLNMDFYKAAFKPINGQMPRLGNLYEFLKTQPGGNSTNSRNFTLLGDPALTLAYPKYEVTTDSINASAVSNISLDTLKALSIVTISGHINDYQGTILNSYNGILSPTVYDKPQSITTLNNDQSASPPYTFKLQKNILYKGKVTVKNGSFKFSFIVPKDIAYNYGIGRISYYAENGNEDANGYYEKLIIGGSNDNAPADAVGPEINLFLNDAKFVFGGTTDENPDLYSTIKDSNGVNTVGNGIGHDITAVLDANTEKVIVLNDYYQADLNSYKSGTIRYSLADMSEGKHTLKLKVWDVYNNSTESYTEFIVAKSAQLALSHVLNYPNPFTTKTQFYFEHNQACDLLEVQVQIFNVSGKLIKNISKFVHTEGFRSEPIEWDGRDEFGDKIGRGVYVYRVKIKTSDGAAAEKFEKLVILN